MNETSEKLNALIEAVEGYPWILILPHTDPDPDAIASAVALRYLLKEQADVNSHIAYSGIVGRAENKTLVRYLKRPMKRLPLNRIREAPALALVDTQPGAGNNALPHGRWAALVIDHHPRQEASSAAAFADVRPEFGATSTILWEHLQAAGLEPPTPIATALFYGIKTDTMGLGRGAGVPDMDAYYDLQPRVDVDALAQIERAQVPREYFISFARALESTRLYDSAVVTDLGDMAYPGLAAEMADLLSRLENAQWVICMGTFRSSLIFAVRAVGQKSGAGRLARGMVAAHGSAGGHGAFAGGQIPLGKHAADQTKAELIRQALELLGLPTDLRPAPLLEAAATSQRP